MLLTTDLSNRWSTVQGSVSDLAEAISKYAPELESLTGLESFVSSRVLGESDTSSQQGCQGARSRCGHKELEKGSKHQQDKKQKEKKKLHPPNFKIS